MRWLKKEGDTVEKGEVLLEIQTDKAVLEVESFASGTLLKAIAQPGETLPVLQVIGFVGEPGEELPEVPKAPPRRAAPAPEKKPAPGAPATPRPHREAMAPPAPAPAAAPPEPVARRFSISPRARRLAKEQVIDATRIPGTGPNGRVIERDVVNYLEQKGYDRLLITPTAKRLAANLDIDVLDLRGSGPGGKVLKADVLKAEREKPRPLSMTRRIIASKMVQSAREIPYFLVTVAVDMTDIAAARAKLNKEGPQKVSFNDIMVKACGFALKSHPIVNGACFGDTYKINEDVNIGIAIDTEEGLIVPVVWDVDKKSLEQVAAESAQVAEKARNKKLLPDDLTGATFTISNMGMLGVESFTAIIPPDQAAILAVGSITDSVVAREGKPAVRKIMRLTLSSDHRIIDGATAARFLNEVREKLENPSWVD